jgi:peptidoglycan/xylan/chitin deacetylase (PgdA/CDA1 family)
VKFSVRPYVCEWQIKELCAREYMSYFVREIPLLLDGTLVPASKRIVLTFDDGYEDFYTEVFPLLQKYQVKATLFVINDFLGKPGYLTGEQVKEIAASGLVEIGAHTMHHQNLTYLSLKDAEAEIEQSKEGLEALLATPVQSFAYPYGRYSRRIVPLVRDAGFTAAVGTDFGYWQSPENLFTLKRIHARAFTGRERWFVIGDGA